MFEKKSKVVEELGKEEKKEQLKIVEKDLFMKNI